MESKAPQTPATPAKVLICHMALDLRWPLAYQCKNNNNKKEPSPGGGHFPHFHRSPHRWGYNPTPPPAILLGYLIGQVFPWSTVWQAMIGWRFMSLGSAHCYGLGSKLSSAPWCWSLESDFLVFTPWLYHLSLPPPLVLFPQTTIVTDLQKIRFKNKCIKMLPRCQGGGLLSMRK